MATEQQHILIVDDDLVLSSMVSEILTEEGFDVTVEHNGEDGLRRAEELKPSLVMLDVMMPGMSGIQVLQQIRQSEWGKHIPALMLTNVNEPETITSSIEQGGSVHYLLKTDWSIEDIVEKIKTTLQSTPGAV
jgi:CheY-like chemotaxis protein